MATSADRNGRRAENRNVDVSQLLPGIRYRAPGIG